MQARIKALVIGATFVLSTPAMAYELAFSIDGTANYDSAGGLSLGQLSGFADNGQYYIDAYGNFSLTFDPPPSPDTLLDGPVSVRLSGTGIGAPINDTAQFSTLAGAPIPYGALVDVYDQLAADVQGSPVATGILNYVLANPTGSVIVGGTDYADYTYSYTGALATGITGAFAIATPYDLNTSGSPVSISTGTIDFGASAQLSPVPEPSAWVVMTLGLGGLGVALRRRKAEVRAGLPAG